MKYIFIIVFILSINLFAQPNVEPGPNQVTMSYEEIITMYPTYHVNPNRWGYAEIYYTDTVLPGIAYYYFNRNRCYAIQYKFWSEDSLESLDAFSQYAEYVGVNSTGSSWRDGPATIHRFWEGPGGVGWGAVMWNAQRIVYSQHEWDGIYYLVWLSIFGGRNTAVYPHVPETRHKMRLQ